MSLRASLYAAWSRARLLAKGYVSSTRRQLSDDAKAWQRSGDKGGDVFDGFINPPKDRPTVPEPFKRLHFPSRLSSENYLEQLGRADWQHTDTDMRIFAAALVIELQKRGLPFYVHTAYRTRKEQDRLYNKGRSKALWPRAPHCQGKAVDIVHSAFHWELTKQEWAWVGQIGKNLAKRLGIEVTWGGDWSFYDPAHWELTDWRADIVRHVDGSPLHAMPKAIYRNKGHIPTSPPNPF